MMRKAKVIGFDSWTGGASNFVRLVPAFASLGIDLTLIHVGSWGSDPGRPSAEVIDSLRVRDVSWYGTRDLQRLLDVENPSGVLFLSTNTFTHRSFNRYCRQRKIPTLLLYHGVLRVSPFDGRGRAYKVNAASQLGFVLDRVGKFLTRVGPTYARALWRTKAPTKDWLRFARDTWRFASGTSSSHRSAEDARTEFCCVYVAGDIEHAVEHYGFKPDQVTAVGNPDLLRFKVAPAAIGWHLNRTAGSGEVMYVDTGLLQVGFVFSSAEDFVDHLVRTRSDLQRQGKRLVLKPHPAHLGTPVHAALRRAEIEMCSDADFTLRLQSCTAAIVEPSSLALVPALMGMPVFLAQYAKLEGQRFGELLTSYPRARFITSVNDFDSLLDEERRHLDMQATRRWIEQNSGPMPAEDMPGRVADVMATMIATR